MTPSERSHVATKHVLAAVYAIIATRTIGTHSHAQDVGKALDLKPVAVDHRQWMPCYGLEPLQIIGYVNFHKVLRVALVIFTLISEATLSTRDPPPPFRGLQWRILLLRQ